MRTHLTILGGLLAAVLVATLLAPVALGQQATSGDTEILVLSNRSDLLSGGDAYVEVVLPDGADADQVVVDVDGRDVTDAFALRRDGRFTGRVQGLAEGENVLTATLAGGAGARITLTNHPVGGPIFSGRQIQPWLCTTEAQGLGAPLDAQCNAPTKTEWFYVAEGGTAFDPYDPENPPDDVAMTKTDDGDEVPFIIRQQTLTQNRGISRVAVLYDPKAPFEPWAPQKGWNHKLFYPFGASCGTVHSQSSAQNVRDFTALSRGFLVATSSMNVLGNNCNTVTSAETVVMLKEHIQERYGSIRYTFGRGGSGGAIGQTMVSNNYPGLLQGITVTSAFPDNISTGAEVFDCHLLVQYLERHPASPINGPLLFSEVSGHGTSANTCPSWEALFAPVSDPRNGCGVPAEEHYDPETNPTGCRGTYQDFSAAIYGPRPESMWTEPERAYGGFAKSTYDNVGIQFGLQALREGDITPEQFVHLNEHIGGFDIDFNNIKERSVGDPGTPGIAYRTGQLVDARQLDEVAIIDTRSTGNVDPLGIHTMHHSFVLKERMQREHGTAANHVLYRGSGSPSAFDVMDEWLTAVEADGGDASLSEKIIANKPARAVDSCYVNNQRRTDKTTCDEAYPYYNAPRSLAAGGPFTHDVIKCQLKPLNRDDYGLVPMTDAQWARMQAAFPQGVCDYSKPSSELTVSVPWLSYAEGPGGQPMGPAPVSVPFGATRDCADAPRANVIDRNQAREVHRASVDCVLHHSIARGTSATTYSPQTEVTRGQMASFVVNTLRTAGVAAGLPAGGGRHEFSDIARSAHATNIDRLARAGIVAGRSGGRFAPNAPISRAQMASFMVSAARWAGVALPAPGDHFGDVGGVHAENINAGYEAGLFSGTTAPSEAERSGTFSPGGGVLRDQMATFLVRLWQGLPTPA